jgi:hypothetical protein
MSEQPTTPKAAKERLHETRENSDGTVYQALCDTAGCGWVGQVYGKEYNPSARAYLAELNAGEHQRAAANWPGTAPSGNAG